MSQHSIRAIRMQLPPYPHHEMLCKRRQTQPKQSKHMSTISRNIASPTPPTPKAAAGNDSTVLQGDGSLNCSPLEGHHRTLDRDRSDWHPVAEGGTTVVRASAASAASAASDGNGNGGNISSVTAATSGGSGRVSGGGVETPAPSQPFSLDTEMNWTATAELVPRRHLVGAGGYAAAGLMGKVCSVMISDARGDTSTVVSVLVCRGSFRCCSCSTGVTSAPQQYCFQPFKG